MKSKDFPLALATLEGELPRAEDLFYEIKLDGYRALTLLERGKARIFSRNGKEWTARFARIREAIEALPITNAVFDGEICAVDEEGRTRFQALQNALSEGDDASLDYFVFDLLFVDGVDVRDRPLHARKSLLASILRDRAAPLRYVTHVASSEKAAPLFEEVCRRGLEGLIAKKRDRPYVGGRGRDWVKVKCVHRQELVIVGFTAPRGVRAGFGALLLGVNDDEGLRYVGKVGTGFTQRSLADLSKQLHELVIARPAARGAPRMRDATWVEPKLVCEVAFTEWTRDGALRHPAFLGLREDKGASEVVRERPREPTNETTKAKMKMKMKKTKTKTSKAATAARPMATSRGADARAETDVVQGVTISHPERVIDAAAGITKLELARYHEAVLPLLLPYAEDRPLALVRCPEGTGAKCFFQKKRWAGAPPSVHEGVVADQDVIWIDDARGLLSLVQFGAVELHGWGARFSKPEKPDWIVMDLDPDEAIPFARVVDAALEMREVLKSLGLQSFVKTTGGKGLHVVAPIAPSYGWSAVKTLARSVAGDFSRRKPSQFTATMAKKTRPGRTFVDYLRNGQGATAVLPYSARTKPGMTVAMPIDWRDVRHVDPRELTVRSVPEHIRKRRTDPWAEFFVVKQSLPAALRALVSA